MAGLHWEKTIGFETFQIWRKRFDVSEKVGSDFWGYIARKRHLKAGKSVCCTTLFNDFFYTLLTLCA
jgi:hypothetical protein